MSIRNKAFDVGFLSSRTFDIPVIAVGNLNVGGTGKSPMIEYLIRLFNKSNHTAVLSRGYGRKTKGFLLGTNQSTALDLGDEPFQFFRKFQDVDIAVDEKRVRGIEKLQQLKPELDLVLLDDAFQHRYVKAERYILLTAYDRIYTDDMMLPTGTLREPKKGAERADCIIVTKCPLNLSEKRRMEVLKQISPKEHQKVFFSFIEYDKHVYSGERKIALDELKDYKILLVTGIANPKSLIEFLMKNKLEFEHIKFSDHEFISEDQQNGIRSSFINLEGEKKIILTTEKDYVRNFLDTVLPVFYLPIKMRILEEEQKFNEIIRNYVRKN